MPHIVIDEKVDLEQLLEDFIPITFNKKTMIKITDMLINYKKYTALFKTLLIGDNHHEYFIELITRDNKTTIRLLPLTDPLKTNAVRHSLILVYDFIKKYYPKSTITKTNLQDHINQASLLS